MELNLIKPHIKYIDTKDDGEEIFEISPLEQGFARGILGNPIRTTLMSNMPGFAVTNVMVEYKEGEEFLKVHHICFAIPGVIPDMTDIYMNVKSIKVKINDSSKENIVTVEKTGPCKVYAGDFETENITIYNKDLELFEITSDTTIKVTLTIKEGKGYKKEENFYTKDVENIAIDADFNPILKVGIEDKEVRVNDIGGYCKLVIGIKTNGIITPKEALDIAIKILSDGYNILREETKSVIENESIYYDVEEEHKEVAECFSIDRLSLSQRPKNALQGYGINTTDDLKRYTKKELSGIKNLGKKSLEEVIEKLKEFNIYLKDE